VSEQKSLVYSHPLVYEWLMRLLYGRAFQARYACLSELIPAEYDVFEACAGDAYLYRHYLAPRGVRYRGADLNAGFVDFATKRGIPIQRLDILNDPVPSADVVLLQASLYQFMPEHRLVVDKLLAAARRMLIIAEPVRNLASDAPRVIRWLAQRATNPGDGEKPLRFNEASLDQFFSTHYADRIQHRSLIPGGREKIYCLRGELAARAGA
jgi:hypothetical protein